MKNLIVKNYFPFYHFTWKKHRLKRKMIWILYKDKRHSDLFSKAKAPIMFELSANGDPRIEAIRLKRL